MAFTNDWSDAVPVDHTKISDVPSKIRNTRIDNEDRLSAIISGFVSGETVKGILNLPFIAQATPSVVTDQIQLYGKAVAGKTELHTLNEDGTENQITDGGAVKVPSAAALMALVGPLMFPVGTVLTFGVSTNPATLLGFGTWTAIAGKVIVGLDAGQTEFDALDETGGAKTHTHTFSGTTGTTSDTGGAGGSGASGTQWTHTHPFSGTTNSGNSLMPYIVKYVWQRTA